MPRPTAVGASSDALLWGSLSSRQPHAQHPLCQIRPSPWSILARDTQHPKAHSRWILSAHNFLACYLCHLVRIATHARNSSSRQGARTDGQSTLAVPSRLPPARLREAPLPKTFHLSRTAQVGGLAYVTQPKIRTFGPSRLPALNTSVVHAVCGRPAKILSWWCGQRPTGRVGPRDAHRPSQKGIARDPRGDLARPDPMCEGIAPLWVRHFWRRGRLRRCRSSVVEHSLGKGEVVSSILTGSTRK